MSAVRSVPCSMRARGLNSGCKLLSISTAAHRGSAVAARSCQHMQPWSQDSFDVTWSCICLQGQTVLGLGQGSASGPGAHMEAGKSRDKIVHLASGAQAASAAHPQPHAEAKNCKPRLTSRLQSLMICGLQQIKAGSCVSIWSGHGKVCRQLGRAASANVGQCFGCGYAYPASCTAPAEPA